MQHIKQIRKGLEMEISNRKNSITFYDRLVKRTFKAQLERLDLIEKILNYPKHKVAVLGTVGAGKTTAICHLFNLIDNITTKSGSLEVQELLKTGPGYTTICEVVLQEGKLHTTVKIEPYSKEDLKNLIIDFCNFIHEKINPDTENNPQTGKNLISTGTKEITSPMGKKSKKTFDEAKEEYQKCNGNLEEFKEKVLARATIDKRITTSLIYESHLGNERKWLKEVFEDLNGGKRAECSMPRKIILSLGKSILENSEFSKFSSVIDTKGLDVNENRKDLDEYIKSSDTVCIFTTGYKDAPDTNIRKLLEYYFADKSAHYQTKFIILVLPQKGQPETEPDADGDRETGIAIRRDIIQNILQNLGISELSDDNILFYDALNHYGEDRSARSANADPIKRDKQEIIESINGIIEARRNFFTEEIEKIRKDFDQIVRGKGLTPQEETCIDKTYEDILSYKNLNFHTANLFVDNFLNDYKQRYAAPTMKAIHRRFGIYTGIKDNNMYYDAQRVAEDMIRGLTKEYYSKIVRTIEKLKNRLNNADLSALIDESSTQFVKFYNEFVGHVASQIYDFLADEKLEKDAKSDFWRDVVNERGSGYKNNVSAVFRDELESSQDGLENANDQLKMLTEKYWEKEVINAIAHFFKR
jgi:hypothetical protein